MAPVTTKDQVMAKLQASRRRLEELLATLTPEETVLPGAMDSWCTKDLLAHLAYWEALQVEWVEAARRGEKPAVPAEGLGFGTKDLAILNERIYQAHCGEPLNEVLAYFNQAHVALVEQLATLSEDDLFMPKRWPFTKGRLVSWYNAFAAHDDWAVRHIKLFIKARKAAGQGYCQ
ncbi:MAG: ClbS/DfsB family four-helix bundle protein [Anaerolineae bacterium]